MDNERKERIDQLHESLLVNPEYRRAYSEEDLIHRVAERVYQVRNLRELTQTELAERIGSKQPRVAKIEGGFANLSLRALAQLACALECRPEDLVDRQTPNVLAGCWAWDSPDFTISTSFEVAENGSTAPAVEASALTNMEVA